jgi:MarR family transcriptional regulator, transcriptional regulator for hemolysin
MYTIYRFAYLCICFKKGNVKKSYTRKPLGKLLSGIGRTLLNELNIKLKDLDIERNFYSLILIEEGDGKITQQDLADLLDSDKVSVVRIVDYLSDKGYVKRVKDLSDKRKFRLTLTYKAEKELPLIREAISDLTRVALKGLPDEKIEEFYDTLYNIKKNLKKEEIKL